MVTQTEGKLTSYPQSRHRHTTLYGDLWKSVMSEGFDVMKGGICNDG